MREREISRINLQKQCVEEVNFWPICSKLHVLWTMKVFDVMRTKKVETSCLALMALKSYTTSWQLARTFPKYPHPEIYLFY